MTLMTWALKRQIFYIGILLLVIFIFGFLLISSSLNRTPSCTDGRKNGDETGVDCGGGDARSRAFHKWMKFP